MTSNNLEMTKNWYFQRDVIWEAVMVKASDPRSRGHGIDSRPSCSTFT